MTRDMRIVAMLDVAETLLYRANRPGTPLARKLELREKAKSLRDEAAAAEAAEG